MYFGSQLLQETSRLDRKLQLGTIVTACFIRVVLLL